MSYQPRGVFASLIAILALSLGLAATAQAQNQYFSDAGGPLPWDNSTPNWSWSSGGAYTNTWNTYDNAYFEGTGGTVNVTGGPICNTMTVNVDGYVFNGDTIGFGNPGNQGITVNSNYTTVNCNIYSPYGNDFQKNGAGTLVMGGANNYVAASLDVFQGQLTLLPGSTTNVAGYLQMGSYTTLNMKGGVLNVGAEIGNIWWGNQNLTINQSGGTINTAGLFMDTGSSSPVTNTVNLTGGKLVLGGNGIHGPVYPYNHYAWWYGANYISDSWNLNLGGGTISASASWNAANGWGMPINIKLTGINGNTTFDTAGNNIGLYAYVYGPGGLLKTGAGALTINNGGFWYGTYGCE